MVVPAIYCTGQVMQIVNCVRIFKRLGVNIIKGLLTFNLSAMVYKPRLPLIIVAVKHLSSLFVLPMSVWRNIKVLQCLCTCIWSRTQITSLEKLNGVCMMYQ